MSIAAYKRTMRDTETPRQIERRLMSQVTGKLDRFAAEFDAAESGVQKLQILSSGLRDALHENVALWSALKYDLMTGGNSLPENLRSSLVSVAMWIERQTSSVVGGASGVAALVAVNRSIVDGLSGQEPGPVAV
ncbi:flaF protein [Mesobaculum littorinae]|uniref:FlaF protein n=1 Tax=Mesobaculum littorinae TaxID=2486419 RepID=A0A438ADV8_9RHOB|nr:flagellar biosynthesis regulator FlaF [Mesobaculum littorinae]RVV96869.1 flaF protein [Mesobaculum littorinae]